MPRARSIIVVNAADSTVLYMTFEVTKGRFALVFFSDRDLIENCRQIQLHEVLLSSERRNDAVHLSQATTIRH